MGADYSVLIIDGESIISLEVIKSLSRHKNIKIHVLSNSTSVRSRYSRHVSSFEVHDKSLKNKNYVDYIEDVVRKKGIDIIFPSGEPGVEFVSKHRSALSKFCKVPLISDIDSFHITQDKWKAHKFFVENNTSTPHSILCNTDVSFKQNLENMRFPVLIKPRIGTGGLGIVEFESAVALTEYLVVNDLNPQDFIVQEKVDGPLIGCSVLAKNGKILAYTIQKRFTPPNKPFAPGIGFKFVRNGKVYRQVSQLIKNLKWSGVGHLQFVYNADEENYYLLEMNPRYWGSLPSAVSMGVDFPYIHCMESLGEPFPEPQCRMELYQVWPSYFKNMLFMALTKENVGGLIKNTNFTDQLFDPLPVIYSLFSKVVNRINKKLRWIYPETGVLNDSVLKKN